MTSLAIECCLHMNRHRNNKKPHVLLKYADLKTYLYINLCRREGVKNIFRIRTCIILSLVEKANVCCSSSPRQR